MCYNQKNEERRWLDGAFVVKKQEKEVISLRLPLETLREIDTRAARAGVSRNELLNQMIVYALAHAEE